MPSFSGSAYWASISRPVAFSESFAWMVLVQKCTLDRFLAILAGIVVWACPGVWFNWVSGFCRDILSSGYSSWLQFCVVCVEPRCFLLFCPSYSLLVMNDAWAHLLVEVKLPQSLQTKAKQVHATHSSFHYLKTLRNLWNTVCVAGLPRRLQGPTRLRASVTSWPFFAISAVPARGSKPGLRAWSGRLLPGLSDQSRKLCDAAAVVSCEFRRPRPQPTHMHTPPRYCTVDCRYSGPRFQVGTPTPQIPRWRGHKNDSAHAWTSPILLAKAYSWASLAGWAGKKSLAHWKRSMHSGWCCFCFTYVLHTLLC